MSLDRRTAEKQEFIRTRFKHLREKYPNLEFEMFDCDTKIGVAGVRKSDGKERALMLFNQTDYFIEQFFDVSKAPAPLNYNPDTWNCNLHKSHVL